MAQSSSSSTCYMFHVRTSPFSDVLIPKLLPQISLPFSLSLDAGAFRPLSNTVGNAEVGWSTEEEICRGEDKSEEMS